MRGQVLGYEREMQNKLGGEGRERIVLVVSAAIHANS